jgi:hypothetical protein
MRLLQLLFPLLLIALPFLLLQFRTGALIKLTIEAPVMLQTSVDTNEEPFSQEITKTRLPVKVTARDIIMEEGFRSPVVIESHKLVFFTVPKAACTTWKQLFRRMMGSSDWKDGPAAHKLKTNGLKLLSKYSEEEATYIMNSPDYTRAIFVRDPKDRLLSAFLNKGLEKNGSYVVNVCCKFARDCWDKPRSFAGFFNLTKKCKDVHWEPVSNRMEKKYWDTLDVVAHMETAESDARKLLERIGAWEEYGRTGWGKYGNESLFARKQTSGHATGASSKLASYYTPELEKLVDTRYTNDYEIHQLGLIKKLIDRG